MGGFVKGDVIVIPFPFSDLSGDKKRPAFVVAPLRGKDIILCQITSRLKHSDDYSVSLTEADFHEGSLPRDSSIRPNRLFTADSSRVLRKAGVLRKKKCAEIMEKLWKILNTQV